MPSESVSYHLADLVDRKAEQVHLANQLQSDIRNQQQELKERLDDLDEEVDEDGLSEGTKRGVRQLEQDMWRWERDNYETMGLMTRELSGLSLLKAWNALPSALKPEPRDPAPQGRVLLLDYATQIDRKLLDEVGRTQQLLAERDQAVEKAIKEKSASDAEKEVLVAKLRAAEADNESYKEKIKELQLQMQMGSMGLGGQDGENARKVAACREQS
ncbi:uncharacterized protein MKK02DRAFT_31989 [Dioszegia hungarica]|uniref:Uncharacterized protein n=1 Tax=Dioszegia hungarica TaxID=4972 RepID=A0AA38HBV6_9TREE|nr:uncharacterized protein MKK02DRAFT_31989 [Dioszegia hungarica]KAI9638573.1 hypothetical protein MKK02DRAFT_31989 [Dioszegia hungarica]